MLKINKVKADKILITIFIINSGNNVFRTFFNLLPNSLSYFIWVFLILIFFIVYKKSLSFSKELSLLFFLLTILIIIQSYFLNFSSITFGKLISLYLIPFYAYLVITFINPNSYRFFPKIMVYIIVINFALWIPNVVLDYLGMNILRIIPSWMLFHTNPLNDPNSIIIHNFYATRNPYFIIRNAGMFWEPGAFAGILIMTYIIFILYIDQFSEKEIRYINIVYFIGLLSSFSTTGLIVYPLVFYYYKILRGKKRMKGKIKYITYAFFYFFLILVLGYIAYNYIPVLKEKILMNIEQVALNKNNSDSNRLGTALFLINIIKENPIFGTGLIMKMNIWINQYLYANLYNSDKIVGNGMFIFIAKAGIPIFVYITYLWYKGFKRLINGPIVFGLVFVLWLLLQGENWMAYPMIYLFMFLKPLPKEGFNIKPRTQQNRSY